MIIMKMLVIQERKTMMANDERKMTTRIIADNDTRYN